MGEHMKWGTKTRGNKNEGETYRVRTRSELTGVVSERVLTSMRSGVLRGSNYDMRRSGGRETESGVHETGQWYRKVHGTHLSYNRPSVSLGAS